MLVSWAVTDGVWMGGSMMGGRITWRESTLRLAATGAVWLRERGIGALQTEDDPATRWIGGKPRNADVGNDIMVVRWSFTIAV